MSAICEQVDNPITAVSLGENWRWASSCSGAILHDLELDDLTPFYAQNSPVNWLGTEQPRDQISIENPEYFELRCPPGYTNPSDSIGIEFLANALRLERAGDLRGSLSIIYNQINELINFGMVGLIDEEIESVPANEIGTDVLLGLLTATLPVKSQLRSRPALFRETRRLLKSRGHFEPGILDGLK